MALRGELVWTEDGQERRFPLADAPVTIGRSSHNQVVIPSPGLSRQHCRISPAGEGLCVMDLGSHNGTVLNAQRLSANTPAPLRSGDAIRLGPVELRLAPPPLALPPSSFDVDEGAGDAAGEEQETRAVPLSGDPARDARNVALLLSTIADIHREEDPARVLPAIVDRVIELAGAERGLLLLRGVDGLETSVARGADGLDLERVADVSRSIPEKVLATGEAVCITGADDWAQASESMREHELRAVLCVPIRARGAVSGVIYVDSQAPAREFGPGERAFLQALASQCGLALERASHIRQEVEERRRLEEENAALKGEEVQRPLAVSPAMDAVLRRLERVAGSDVTLLIGGETGAGKEVLARWVHALSHRRAAPFVVVDCGAIPESLLESVLFGHVKGAFTGATADSEGLARRAHGGTLLLDEVGELPLALQPKLLRFLEERTVLPVGSVERLTVDVRVIACTHRDLQACVQAGAFREDLYFRLAAFPVQVPPLRERREDVVPLARLLLARERGVARAPHLSGFTHEALRALEAYPWPGNVRELAHRIQRAAVTAEPPFITVTDLDLTAPQGGAVGVLPLPDARRAAMDRFEREYVSELLRRHKGRVIDAAREAGVSRQMFQRLMARHGISRAEFKA